jgi:hypothetical protein
MISPSIIAPKDEKEKELAFTALECKLQMMDGTLPKILKTHCEEIPGWEWELSEEEIRYLLTVVRHAAKGQLVIYQ